MSRPNAHRNVPVLLIALLAVVSISGLAAQASSTPSQRSSAVLPASDEVAQRGQALADLRTCLNREDAVLDVYYLIDNSSSMKQIGAGPGTDENGLRFRAVQSSLRPLQDLANEGRVVNVAGGIFSSEARTQTLVDWTRLEAGSAVGPEQIGDMLASEDPKGGTNWVTGLQEAERQLDRQAQGSDNHCQALVWVTDGGIDIERDPVKTSEGLVDLCGVEPTDFISPPSTQGLMYELRNQGVVVLGVLLAVPDSDQAELSEGTRQERKSKTSYFGPVVEGRGEVDASWFNGDISKEGLYSCGATVTGAAGATLTIETADQLANQFDALASCIADTCTTLPPGSVRCQGGSCEVAVPSGIASMQFSVPEDYDPNDVKQPGGASACLIDGCTTTEELASGAPLRIPVRNESGIWTIENSPDDLNPLLFAGLSLEADQIEVDPRDPNISSRLRIIQSDPSVGPDALIFDAQNYENLRWEANVFFPTGRSEPARVTPDGDSWKIEWESGSAESRGSIPREVIVGFSATARGNGADVPPLPLAPIEQPFPVERLSLEAYPTLVEPQDGATLFFSDIDGLEGVGEASIVIRGPETNEGLVCWPAAADGIADEVQDSASRPRGALDVRIDQGNAESGRCPEGDLGIVLPQAQEVQIPIELTYSEQADGVVRGVLAMDLYGPAEEPPILEEVVFEVETSVVRNNVVRLLVLAVLTIVGIGIPYLILVILARRQASFNTHLNGTRWASLPILLGPEGIASIEERDAADYDFLFVADKGITRTIQTGSEEHRVIPPTIWPFKPVSTVVTASRGSWIFTNHDQDLTRRRNQGLSSQVLGDVFYFVTSSQGSQAGTSAIEVDDWGKPAVANSAKTGTVGGHVVVLASGETAVAESIAQALARVRTWAGWTTVYQTVTSAESSNQEPREQGTPAAPAESTGNGQSQTSIAATGFEGAFGAAEADQSSQPPRKRRIGRKKRGREEGDEPTSSGGMDLSDW